MESLGGGRSLVGEGERERDRERGRGGKKALSVLVFNVRHCAPVCVRVCVVVQASTQSVGKAGGGEVRVLSQWLRSVVDFCRPQPVFTGRRNAALLFRGGCGIIWKIRRVRNLKSN